MCENTLQRQLDKYWNELQLRWTTSLKYTLTQFCLQMNKESSFYTYMWKQTEANCAYFPNLLSLRRRPTPSQSSRKSIAVVVGLIRVNVWPSCSHRYEYSLFATSCKLAVLFIYADFATAPWLFLLCQIHILRHNESPDLDGVKN